MKKNKRIFCGLLGVFSLGFLAGCDGEKVENTSKTENLVDQEKTEINIIKNDKLAIDQNRCIGCGKCARVAPDNFEMNTETRKAQVKSTEIINQAEVTRAMEGCPVSAISQ
ncbi:MAG: ferredoxin [Candidatus Moranbacteria bacterium]|jgi:ferredoxin|nr:ferredoxin [Candidatus Moranbacteria bacterium]